MSGFIEREQILLKHNVYDLLHNTRRGGKAFLFIIWLQLSYCEQIRRAQISIEPDYLSFVQ